MPSLRGKKKEMVLKPIVFGAVTIRKMGREASSINDDNDLSAM